MATLALPAESAGRSGTTEGPQGLRERDHPTTTHHHMTSPKPPVLVFRTMGYDGSTEQAVDVPTLLLTKLFIQAASGGGKSWAIRYLLEQTQGLAQHIVIDPEGEFHTLRERFPYLLASHEGEGADVPLHQDTAAQLATGILATRANVVLDLFGMEDEARALFVAKFLRELMERPRDQWNHPIIVVVDEAHRWGPEGSGQGRDMTPVNQSSRALARGMDAGRKRGICFILATQRMTKLRNDMVAECQNKLVGLTGLGTDRKRAADELGLDTAQRRALSSLRPGEFYAYGPAFVRESRDVFLCKTGPVATTHPKTAGTAAVGTVAPAPESVRALALELREAMKALAPVAPATPASDPSATTAGAAAESSGEMRKMARQVAELSTELGTVRRCLDGARVSRKATALRSMERVRAAHEAVEPVAAVLKSLAGDLFSLVQFLKEDLATTETIGDHGDYEIVEGEAQLAPLQEYKATAQWESTDKGVVRSAAVEVTPLQNFGTKPGTLWEAMTDRQRKIMEQVARLALLGIHQPLIKTVGLLCGISPKSSRLMENMRQLEGLGLVVIRPFGAVALALGAAVELGWENGTAADIAGKAPPPTIHELWGAIGGLLGERARKMWEYLTTNQRSHHANGPLFVAEWNTLAQAAGRSPTSSRVGEDLAELMSLGVVERAASGGNGSRTRDGYALTQLALTLPSKDP